MTFILSFFKITCLSDTWSDASESLSRLERNSCSCAVTAGSSRAVQPSPGPRAARGAGTWDEGSCRVTELAGGSWRPRAQEWNCQRGTWRRGHSCRVFEAMSHLRGASVRRKDRDGYRVMGHLLYSKLKVYSQLHVGTSSEYIACRLFLFVSMCKKCKICKLVVSLLLIATFYIAFIGCWKQRAN